MTNLMPDLVFFIEVPQRPNDLAKRLHNRFAKEALREAIAVHHKKTIPRHFKRSAAARYRHKPRSKRYSILKQKIFRTGGMDLVKTGRSRSVHTHQYRARFGGSGTQGNLSATMILRWPFKGGTGRIRYPRKQRPGAVTVADMNHEMQTIVGDEARLISETFSRGYMRRVKAHRSTRKRVRIS